MTEIRKVSPLYMEKVVDLWIIDPKIAPKVLAYAQINNHHFAAVDNSTNDCWYEEFYFEEDAIAWLKGEEIDYGTPSWK